MDDEERTFSLSTDAVRRLAIAASMRGALNASVLRFLSADPFGVDISDLEHDLEAIGRSAASAIRLVELSVHPQEGDLEEVVFASYHLAGTSLLLASHFLELVGRAGVAPRMATPLAKLEEEVHGLLMNLPGMREALSYGGDSRSGEPEPAAAEPEGSAEEEAADLEARRRELAAIRAYLEWVKPEDPQQGRFHACLVSLVEYLESSLDAAAGDGHRDEVCWQALRASLPLAEPRRSPLEPVRAMDLDDDDEELLARFRFCRRLLSIARPPDPAVDETAWMLMMTNEPLSLLLTACYGGDAAVTALSELEVEGGDRVLRWDEEPCYARDPATAPEGFLRGTLPAVRRSEAAAVRAFLAGVEPEPGDQAAFHAACLALVDRLERDLAAREVDPDWEDLLWRLLRVFLPLADPLWAAAHPKAHGELLGEVEARRVAGLGDYCAAARPGRKGVPAARARGMIIGAVMSAQRIHAIGGCAMGDKAMEEARDAFFRYVGRA